MITYELKKSNRKTMSLKVDSSGKLIVYAPYFFTENKINEFVLSKENWIKKCQKEAFLTNEKYKTKDLKEGDFIYFLGEKYMLKFANVKAVEFVKKQQKYCILPANYQKNTENKLKTYMKKQAEWYLKDVLDSRAKILNLTYNSFRITYARQKWGSCSSKKEIMLNFRLMLCKEEIIEYVITHELVHLLELNHGKNFYSRLNYYYPNSKDYIKWLKENSGILNAY